MCRSGFDECHRPQNARRQWLKIPPCPAAQTASRSCAVEQAVVRQRRAGKLVDGGVADHNLRIRSFRVSATASHPRETADATRTRRAHRSQRPCAASRTGRVEIGAHVELYRRGGKRHRRSLAEIDLHRAHGDLRRSDLNGLRIRRAAGESSDDCGSSAQDEKVLPLRNRLLAFETHRSNRAKCLCASPLAFAAARGERLIREHDDARFVRLQVEADLVGIRDPGRICR